MSKEYRQANYCYIVCVPEQLNIKPEWKGSLRSAKYIASVWREKYPEAAVHIMRTVLVQRKYNDGEVVEYEGAEWQGDVYGYGPNPFERPERLYLESYAKTNRTYLRTYEVWTRKREED